MLEWPQILYSNNKIFLSCKIFTRKKLELQDIPGKNLRDAKILVEIKTDE